MMTDSSNAGVADTLDTGPLSWVMGEIREALTRSMNLFGQAAAQEAEEQQTTLRQARIFLHQAHGALHMVDVDGVTVVTGAADDILERLAQGGLALSGPVVQALASTSQAVIEYLEELLAGAPHQPVRLFPYYKALLEARAADRIHPSDLFFPNLAIRPKLPPAPAIAALDSGALRQRYEKALLPFLKSSERAAELANAAHMRDVIGEVERAQGNEEERAFWWVMHGFASLVAAGGLANEVYVKQLFARINMQMRRLGQEGAGNERLLRDALFFMAQAENLPPEAEQIRQVYQLDGLVPADFERRRYGRIDGATLASAREQLSLAKSLWNRIAAGEGTAVAPFDHAMQGLTEAGGRLDSASLAKLLRELNGIARHAAHSNPGDSLGLEVAGSLLFIENALAHASRLGDDFPQRADALTARLLAMVAGEQPGQETQWLDDMSRTAQQRETMLALAGEMQASLGQVEKNLDEYFSNPARQAVLEPIDPILHQIEGALAIIDQDDARQAVGHLRAAVHGFAQADPGLADEGKFRHVAGNIGALSFFIENLQVDPEGAGKHFSFDRERGVFQSRVLEKGTGAAKVREVVVEPLPAPAGIEAIAIAPPPELALSEPAAIEPAVAESVATGQAVFEPAVVEPVATEPTTFEPGVTEQAVAEAAAFEPVVVGPASAEPSAPVPAVTDLAATDLAATEPTSIDLAAAGSAVSEAAYFDTAQVEEITAGPARTAEATDLSGFADFPEQDSLAGKSPAPAAMPPANPLPASDEAADAELLEIFLTEADEVLETVRGVTPGLRRDPNSLEHMTTLRRSFHTLKGSSRMVGLMAFGDTAWAIEQVFNRRLSEGQEGSSELYSLLDLAVEELGGWVADLKQSGHSVRSGAALVAAADRVRNGLAMPESDEAAPLPEAEAPFAGSQPTPEFPAQDVVVEAADAAETGELAETAQAVETGELTETGEVTEVTEATGTAEPAPTGKIIGFPDPHRSTPQADDNIKYIGALEISVPLHNIYLAETDELVRLLAQDVAEWRHEPLRPVNILAVHAAHSLAGSSATVGFVALQEVAHALEMILQQLARKPVPLRLAEFDVTARAIDCMKAMLKKFALCEMPPHEPRQVRLLKDLKDQITARSGSPASAIYSAVPAFEAEEDPAGLGLEDVAPEQEQTSTQEPEQAEDTPSPLAGEGRDEGAFASAQPLQAPPHPNPLPQGEREPADSLRADGETPQPTPAGLPRDDLDPDLLPVFQEEGRDILPQLGKLLRGWQQAPADPEPAPALQRLLHTIKGSARMAGAMGLGQHMHDMESRIDQITRMGHPSAAAIEDLLGRLDVGLALFEQLQNPQAAKTQADATRTEGEEALPVAGATGRGASGEMVLLPSVTPVVVAPGATAATSAPPVAVPLVRVRADLLDRLVNQAGEVSISRSRVETEVSTLKQSLSELTENLMRLRGQLREIEIQAESQMASQAQAVEREFDPLEFDRFTRLQELTRMMAETVSDVASVQQNLNRTVEEAGNGLAAQARLTRDLQQDLMRVRMVQFASIAERLYRVTRQASKELDKRVNLDIHGGSVEMDRSVLEKMVGPFEHLLRNAIVHGIEARTARHAAGKNETGELLIEVRQEGNEVVLQFSDDGRGLDLARIQERAIERGMLASGQDVPAAELRDLIFHPGFTTAQEITELAGRGIGMDVVRSEALALGGRIAIDSEPGKGAQFTIHLPLTLAVTQVVVLTTGARTYAVPSVLVEQVQQLKANALASVYNDGAVLWQNRRVPLYYLSTLLGDRESVPVTQQYSPIVILKSGNDRVAIHVDEVQGNREVVVKNIGPQLARMVGIAGATVLGAGEIVLILDPVPLAQRLLQEQARAPRLPGMAAQDEMGAVAEMALPQPLQAPQPFAPYPEPVQGLRAQPIVMVVDDSLTVRRVTQRLLAREGYQVVLAKDGVDALEQLQAITPDVMLVDIEMPRMDGFDLTRNVRGDERTRHIPIVMITSRTATKHRNYALELGVNEYLGKPYQESDLLKLIAAFVAGEAPVA